MRESCTYGSVRGALSNERPYRNRTHAMLRGAHASIVFSTGEPGRLRLATRPSWTGSPYDSNFGNADLAYPALA